MFYLKNQNLLKWQGTYEWWFAQSKKNRKSYRIHALLMIWMDFDVLSLTGLWIYVPLILKSWPSSSKIFLQYFKQKIKVKNFDFDHKLTVKFLFLFLLVSCRLYIYEFTRKKAFVSCLAISLLNAIRFSWNQKLGHSPGLTWEPKTWIFSRINHLNSFCLGIGVEKCRERISWVKQNLQWKF